MAKKRSDKTSAELECPLYLHKKSGQWCKTIKGRRHHFGRDKEAAVARWYREKDDLLSGKAPRDRAEIVTAAYLCNYVLTRKKQSVELGDLSLRQFNDLKTMSTYLLDHFGRNRSVATIGPDDLGELRKKMVMKWAPSGLVSRIRNIRHIFNFAYENDLLEKPIKFGSQFSPPSVKKRREYRNEQDTRLFTAEEVRQLLDSEAASPHVRAFIWLGINAGLGNSDIAKMEQRHIDLDDGWLNYPRPKTAVARRAKLWRETLFSSSPVVRTE